MEFSTLEASHNSILRQLDRMFPYDNFPGYNISNGLVLAFTAEAAHLKAELVEILEESRLPFLEVQNEGETPDGCFARGYASFRQSRLDYVLPDNAMCCFVLVGGNAAVVNAPEDILCRRFNLMPPEHPMPENRPTGQLTLRMLDCDNPARQLSNLLFTILLDPDRLSDQDGMTVRADIHQANKQHLALRMRNLLYMYLEKSSTDEELQEQVTRLVEESAEQLPPLPTFSGQPVDVAAFSALCRKFPRPPLAIKFLEKPTTVRLQRLAENLYGENAPKNLLDSYRTLAAPHVRQTTTALWQKKQTNLLDEGSSNLDTRLFKVLCSLISRQETILAEETACIRTELEVSPPLRRQDVMRPDAVFSAVDNHFRKAANATRALLLLDAYSRLASKETNREFWVRRSNAIRGLQSWHNFLSNYLMPGLREQRATNLTNLQISWETSPETICRSCSSIGDRWFADTIQRIYRSAPMPAGHAVKDAVMVCDELFAPGAEEALNTAGLSHDASGKQPHLHYLDGFGPENVLMVWFCS